MTPQTDGRAVIGTLREDQTTLDIQAPLATCGHCRFTTALTGSWSVEDGQLVFRADADAQPRRGPDLESCCESDPVIQFTRITVDDELLTDEQVRALRATAREAIERAW